MADQEHLKILSEGVTTWNEWRRGKNTPAQLSGTVFDGLNLSGVDLRGADLSHSSFVQTRLDNADLSGANLAKAFMVEARLEGANLREARLSGADLAAANLTDTDLTEAVLDAADLSWAILIRSKLCRTDLTLTRLRASTMQMTDLTNAFLDGTLFADTDLRAVVGLTTCKHNGPSVLDHITLQRSGPLPTRFLRGAGLQEVMIMAASKLHKSPEYYTCFISYSDRDRKFAHKLREDLEQINIRCWFAPHDMPIGGKVLDTIDNAIRLRDKVLLILSKNSLESEWVEDEVTKAFEEERKRGQEILFPVRLDDSIMDSKEPWAAKLRGRHIGDFRRWPSPKAYEETFERVRRDLLRMP